MVRTVFQRQQMSHRIRVPIGGGSAPALESFSYRSCGYTNAAQLAQLDSSGAGQSVYQVGRSCHSCFELFDG